MAPPDLSTPEARDAYKAELRAIGRPLRFAGLLIVVAGALLAIFSRFTKLPLPPWIDTAIFATLGLGWAILFYNIFQRSQYHRRRMAGQ
jgi:hypothetical protein